jgi:hypothetical protein
VRDDSGQADVQFIGYLFIDKPFCDEYQHLNFTGG